MLTHIIQLDKSDKESGRVAASKTVSAIDNIFEFYSKRAGILRVVLPNLMGLNQLECQPEQTMALAQLPLDFAYKRDVRPTS